MKFTITADNKKEHHGFDLRLVRACARLHADGFITRLHIVQCEKIEMEFGNRDDREDVSNFVSAGMLNTAINEFIHRGADGYERFWLTRADEHLESHMRKSVSDPRSGTALSAADICNPCI